jgi:hypothetical protein
MIAEIAVQPLFERTRRQAQSLAPHRHLYGLQIQIGGRLVP